jgi:hypothetical protein
MVMMHACEPLHFDWISSHSAIPSLPYCTFFSSALLTFLVRIRIRGSTTMPKRALVTLGIDLDCVAGWLGAFLQ